MSALNEKRMIESVSKRKKIRGPELFSLADVEDAWLAAEIINCWCRSLCSADIACGGSRTGRPLVGVWAESDDPDDCFPVEVRVEEERERERERERA